MTELFDIWFIPTAKGRTGPFGRHERKITRTPIRGREDAELECYLMNCDDPAPDKHEYGSYVLRPALHIVRGG